MRLTFDYVTFSVIGLSATFLCATLLPFSQASVSSQSLYPLRFTSQLLYPVRFTLPAFPLGSIDIANGMPVLADRVDAVAEFETSDDAKTVSPPEELAAKPSRAGKFAALLGDGSPATNPTGATSRAARSFGNVLPVQYDLGAYVGSSGGLAVQSSKALAGTIDVRKRIRVGKAAPTRIDVKIGSGANIYVNVAQLSSILETQGKVLREASSTDLDGFVSLDELRGNGFKVRYDAVGDALVVDGEV